MPTDGLEVELTVEGVDDLKMAGRASSWSNLGDEI
jgi:hypothetical protein